jgi:deoxyribonuclease V
MVVELTLVVLDVQTTVGSSPSSIEIMYLVLDVHYGSHRTQGACVGFKDPRDDLATFTIVEAFAGAPAPYQPGSFKTRELPYLWQLVSKMVTRVPHLTACLIDGYSWLGDRPGLGQSLHEMLASSVPVIGVAKTRFRSAPAVEVVRGQSRVPLFVTASGIDKYEAAALVQTMHGAYRIPTMLRLADTLARRGVVSPR